MKIKVRLEMADGAIVLYDTLAAQGLEREEAIRNIYRVRSDGSTAWQVASRQESAAPFTNVYFDSSGALKAYAWDGGEYTLDLESGAIVSSTLIR